jgi:hypothetical protein
MPYQPYDTGWIRSIYSILCLGWFLLTNGLLPRFTVYSFFNNVCIPISEVIIYFCEFTGASAVNAGNEIIQVESIVFSHIDYIAPWYKCVQYNESLFKHIDVNIGPPSFYHTPSNIRRRKTSAGKHLGSYFARKRRLQQHQIIISGSNQSKNDTKSDKSNYSKPIFHPTKSCVFNFHPMDDPSCQDNTWYDAISPYWTGGMIWDGAYVLNHQVVSVTTDPIFVSNLPLALELSATIQAPEARSEGENVGPRASIALDSGSSIHIFKD